MNRRMRSVVVIIAVLAVGVLVWRVWSPRADDAAVLTGYVEGDDLYLSSPVAGPVGAVYVVKGQRVDAGAPQGWPGPWRTAAHQHLPAGP